jgi:hypothetical protein
MTFSDIRKRGLSTLGAFFYGAELVKSAPIAQLFGQIKKLNS